MIEKLMVTVHIPCKVHIKKFLIGRYGPNHTMSKKSLLGTIVFHLLDKKCPKPNIQLDDYKQNYDILVPEFYFNVRGYNIGYKKKHYLALCFEKIFFEDMLQNIELAASEYNTKPIQAMRNFLKKYEITENDVNFDSIYRQYQREKKPNKIN
jgi:hypothetical protein